MKPCGILQHIHHSGLIPPIFPELAGTQVARVAVPGGGGGECGSLQTLPASQPWGCSGFMGPKMCGQQSPVQSPEHPPGQQRAAAGCTQLLFSLVLLPLLGSHGELVLSGSLMVLKENFLLVPGSLFLFLCLDKQDV